MKLLKKICVGIFVLLFLLFIIYIGLYIYAKISPKLSIDGANGYYLYDANEKLYHGTNNEWVNLNNISSHLIDATISIEDKNFYKHKGFDYLRILKAMFINVKNKDTIQGASTITQQYSKNLFLDFDKTWSRKIKEAWITLRLESHYSKDEILEGYLNTINYGGIFGIENASKYYFNKSSSDLNLAEATMLAGIPKNPSKYSPLINEKSAKKRQRIILESMIKNKYISTEDKDKVLNTNLIYKTNETKDNLKNIMYYQDSVIDELESLDEIPSSFLDTGGLKIYTNLDTNAQQSLESSVNDNITNDKIEVAGIMVEPNSGKILGLIGGKDYSKSQYNRATKSKRQIGSTIKPFLYYSALENGFTASTTFTSEKTTFNVSNGTYTPKNYNDKYANGDISMATAIAYSDNIYAVKTHLFLGEESLVDILKRVGITSNLEKVPSLALGTSEMSLMEITGAYNTLASGGYKNEPYLINKVTDMNGNVLYEHKNTNENILNKNSVYILNELLTTTYSKNFINYNFPTCFSISQKMSKKYAIKSGTTNTDDLIFGYNNDLLVGLWSGYDDNQKVNDNDSLDLKNTWVNTMEKYLINKKDSWYKTPENVVGVTVNPISGKIDSKSKTILYYLKGTEPSAEENLNLSIETSKVKE